MFIPPAFAETDLPTLQEFIEQNSFGLLVSEVAGSPFATHLPFLLDRQAGPFGTLIGHLAKANPQWQEVGDQTVLAVFSGPHAYISPTWYEAEHVVPTWNYLAVHAYGPITIVQDEPSLLEIVQQSVAFYERGKPKPWSLDTSATYVNRLLSQIVGFHIPLTRVEGKFKLNQNHPGERRKKVITALRAQTGESAQAIADAMQAGLPGQQEFDGRHPAGSDGSHQG